MAREKREKVTCGAERTIDLLTKPPLPEKVTDSGGEERVGLIQLPPFLGAEGGGAGSLPREEWEAERRPPLMSGVREEENSVSFFGPLTGRWIGFFIEFTTFFLDLL